MEVANEAATASTFISRSVQASAGVWRSAPNVQMLHRGKKGKGPPPEPKKSKLLKTQVSKEVERQHLRRLRLHHP